MLSARVSVSCALGLIVAGCCRVSPQEKRVVGTWEFSGIDFTNRVVFHCNHTSEELYMRDDGLLAKILPWAAMSRGTWKLEGDTIVTDEQTLIGPEPRRRRVIRMKILEFRPNELVRDEGRDPFHRVK